MTPADQGLEKLAGRLEELARLDDPCTTAREQLKRDLGAAAIHLRHMATAMHYRLYDAPDYVLRDVAADYFAFWPENWDKPVRFMRAVSRPDAWAIAQADGYDHTKEQPIIKVTWFNTQKEAESFLERQDKIVEMLRP
jgi:hypothetical protein